jgi:outer membrane immunogenic protein
MNRILAAAIGLIVCAAASPAAMAADMPAPVRKAPATIAAPFTWAGVYVGATAGYGWGDTYQFEPGARSPNFDWDGFVGGLTAGANLQAGALVLGVEADISYSGIRAKHDADFPSWGCGTPDLCLNEVEWFGTARGRVGYAVDRFLPFVTGGFAFGRVKASTGLGCPTDRCVSDTETGWTVGGGFEWAFAPNWSAKVEYLYVDLGKSFNAEPTTTLGLETQFSVVRAGINYRFATGKAPSPVVTKY